MQANICRPQIALQCLGQRQVKVIVRRRARESGSCCVVVEYRPERYGEGGKLTGDKYSLSAYLASCVPGTADAPIDADGAKEYSAISFLISRDAILVYGRPADCGVCCVVNVQMPAANRTHDRTYVRICQGWVGR